MTKEVYTQHITELIQQCQDTDLLDLIYKMLLQETSDQAPEVV